MDNKIIIRPSAVDTFYNCGYQWYHVFILGIPTIPGARAAMGTAIHAAAQVMWTDAIISKEKDANRTKLKDAAVAEFQELDKEGIKYDKDENYNTAEAEILTGVDTFIDDIVPWVDIPKAVEQRYTIKLNHPVVESLSGTVDYISEDCIDDLKTSKRKPVPQSYETQQSIYKLLAEANGHEVKHNRIQGIVLKKVPEGHVMELTPNVPKAKALVNTMLDTLQLYYEDKVDPNILFRGNPKYYLCDPRYCNLYSKCRYVNGEPK